ncbi:hypothetical protein L798_12810 [Zootermopsis nevadensis]|uniref:Uncharacterized protein n=1 Tax=Zootermopsis nevadensis TaxID=136037 RepID=A0A067RFQ4_ZOONE|nr:hypothetical protein L798_12810 [Zootermopsis nevadensis]
MVLCFRSGVLAVNYQSSDSAKTRSTGSGEDGALKSKIRPVYNKTIANKKDSTSVAVRIGGYDTKANAVDMVLLNILPGNNLVLRMFCQKGSLERSYTDSESLIAKNC